MTPPAIDVLFTSLCLLAGLAWWYLTYLGIEYNYKLITFNGNPPILHSHIVNLLAIIYSVQLIIPLLLFVMFYAIQRRSAYMQSGLFIVILVVAASFTGDFIGYMVFGGSQLGYLPFLLQRNLAFNLAYQQSLLGDLVFSTIMGNWLVAALASVGGYFTGSMGEKQGKMRIQ